MEATALAATKIKVTFTSVDVLDDSDWFGPGEWVLKATIKRVATNETIAVGDPEKTHEVNTGDKLTLNWSHDIDIKSADTKLEIVLEGKDEDLIFDDDLGRVKLTLNTPIVHAYDLRLKSSEAKFVARLQVSVLAETSGRPGRVTSIVERFDSDTYTTIHDEMLSKMVHLCPVIPVPWAHGIPPLARGVRSLTASPQVNLAVSAATRKLNGLVNPALIPVISPTRTGFANRCARIRITQYRPADLDLRKIIWTAATSNIKFFHGGATKTEVKGGQEVNAFGVMRGDADEEGKIEVRWDSEGKPLLAVYRVWVGKPKKVWTRANIIKCSRATVGGVPLQNPTFTPAQVKSHIAFSNVLLWQMGIQLVMDKDRTARNGAVRKDEGIFEVTNATNHTFNVVKDARIVAPMLNSRKGVFNLVYVHSCAGRPNLLGSATDRRLSEPEAKVSLSGTPSTSWIRPTGVFPDSATKKIEMKRMGPSNQRANDQKPLCGDGAIEQLCACLITQNDRIANGSVTLAHELGHVIGVHHRGSGGNVAKASYDEVNHLAGPRKGWGHPWDENCMSYGSDNEAQDFDMLQIKVIRAHKLVTSVAPPAPKPPPPPPGPPPPKVTKPVPAIWLPNKAAKTLLQEYLCTKRPGLNHTGYDLGTTGPDGDGVDGVVGRKTKAALRSFQRDHGGLVIDAVYGPKTHGAFDEELNGP